MKNCPHRPGCDGCPEFEIPESASHHQLLKDLKMLFELHGLSSPTNVHSRGPNLGYRNRARMVVKDGELGFYKNHSRDFVGVVNCAVHVPEIESVLRTLRPLLPAIEDLRFVDLRVNESGDGVLTLIGGRPLSPVSIEHVREQLRGAFPAIQVHATVSDSGAVMPGSEDAPTLQMAGLECPADAFFQVNQHVLEGIHQTIRGWYQGQPVLDMYCGVGTHSVAGLLEYGKTKQKVRGFDVAESAVAAAARNAARYEIDATFVTTRDTEVLPWQDLDGHVIVVNPGRAGLSRELVNTLMENAPDAEIFYISCQPPTFCRDLERLRPVWTLKEVECWDMMPRTGHVELVARLSPTRAKRPEVHAESNAWFGIVKGEAPHGKLPTRPEQAELQCRVMKRFDQMSVVLLRSKAPIAEDEVRQRLRAWKFPVVGDDQYGDRALNLRLKRELYLDTAALSPASDVPGSLLWLAKLPKSALIREMKS